MRTRLATPRLFVYARSLDSSPASRSRRASGRLVLSSSAAAKALNIAFWLFFACLFNVQSWAQGGQMLNDVPLQRIDHPDQFHSVASYETDQGTAVLVIHMFAEKNGIELDRPARLELRDVDDRSGLYQIVGSHQEGVFTNVVHGSYDIMASAVGYLNTHQEIHVTDTSSPTQIDLVLQRDPSAIDLADVKGLMSREARKEAKHAVSLLKAGSLAEAQPHLEHAYKLAPLNSDLNFLLGYLFFEKKDYARAESYLGTAESLSPHSAPTLTLLGRADLAQNNFPAAKSALEQAALADEEDWQPHNFLADAYLHEKQYGKARDEAQIAIAKGEKYGKNAAGPAELILGQALIGLGQKDEAIQAFSAFVKESRDDPMVYQVRPLIAELQKPPPTPASGATSGRSIIDIVRAEPLEDVPAPKLSTQTWRPPDIDDAKPALIPGIACPGTQVLAEAGKRVQDLVQDLARFTADEDLLHKSIDAFDFAGHVESRKYSYVAVISPEPGQVFIQEYRSDKITQGGNPGAIGSTGFVLLALVFHPDLQGDYEFNCEGQGDWKGQAAWLVHFRQRHDRPNRMHGYSIGGEVFRVDLKGRAWITADKFQIVRIEADMVNPLHEIQLLSEHQTVEYGPVPFPRKNTVLWLPKDAEIYFDFRKHYYYRRHSFDHYMLLCGYGGETQHPIQKPRDNGI